MMVKENGKKMSIGISLPNAYDAIELGKNSNNRKKKRREKLPLQGESEGAIIVQMITNQGDFPTYNIPQ